MLVNDEVINELYFDAGSDRVQKARTYVKTRKVEISKINYKTHISVEDGEIIDVTCECPDYQKRYAACKHVIATIIEFDTNSQYEKMIGGSNVVNIPTTLKSDSRYRSFKQIVNEFYAEEMQEIEQTNIQEELKEKIKIEPKLIYDRYTNNLRIEFKIGNQRMYKLKNLTEFYDRMMTGEKYRYGNKLEFIHKKEMFQEEDQELLDFILRHSEIIRFINSNANSNYRYYGQVMNEGYILLNNTGIDQIFDILKEKRIAFQKEYKDEQIDLRDENPDLHFIMKKKGKEEYEIVLNKKTNIMREIEILNGKSYKYILYENRLYRCDKKYEQTTFSY